MWTLKFCHKANFGTLFQNEINTQFTKVNKILCQSGVEVFSCSSCLFPWRGLQTTLARNILNFSHQIENGLARTLAYPSLMFAGGKHRGTNTNSQFVFQKRSANNFCKEIFWILRTRPKGRSQKKKTGKCGNFSQMGDPPPPPCLGMKCFFLEKSCFFLAF